MIAAEASALQFRTAISNVLEHAVSSGLFPGISFVAVGQNGEILCETAHGHRDFAKTEPITLYTSGFMASMTKLMTSIAAMQVVERGMVGLDDDTAQFVPELGRRPILTSFDESTNTAAYSETSNAITLRHLLSHASGFAYDGFDERLLKLAKATGKENEMLRGKWEAYDRPLVFNPGTSWQYGTGVDWAGKIIEAVSNLSLEQYMQQNIWEPLGMTNTTFHPDRRAFFPMLELGLRSAGPLEPTTLTERVFPIPIFCEMGGAGIYSNASDYARMLGGLLSASSGLLHEESIGELVKPQLSPDSKAGLAKMRGLGMVQTDIPQDVQVDHGLGGLIVSNEIPGRRSAGSICWDGMTNSNWVLDRKLGFACVMCVQVLPPQDLASKRVWTELETLVYQHVHGRRAVSC